MTYNKLHTLKVNNLSFTYVYPVKLSLINIINISITPRNDGKVKQVCNYSFLFIFPSSSNHRDYLQFLEFYIHVFTQYGPLFLSNFFNTAQSFWDSHVCKMVNSFFLLSILHYIDVPQLVCPLLVIDYYFQLLTITNKAIINTWIQVLI